MLSTGFDISGIASGSIRIILGCIGLYLVLRLIWGGFLMMTHGDKDELRDQAESVLKEAFIGMVVVAVTSSFTPRVVNALISATSNFTL